MEGLTKVPTRALVEFAFAAEVGGVMGIFPFDVGQQVLTEPALIARGKALESTAGHEVAVVFLADPNDLPTNLEQIHFPTSGDVDEYMNGLARDEFSV
tara:strand:+ start:581 stop:874 length:294 start_codon:yes stop_codon:yes gene_type:complete